MGSRLNKYLSALRHLSHPCAPCFGRSWDGRGMFWKMLKRFKLGKQEAQRKKTQRVIDKTKILQRLQVLQDKFEGRNCIVTPWMGGRNDCPKKTFKSKKQPPNPNQNTI